MTTRHWCGVAPLPRAPALARIAWFALLSLGCTETMLEPASRTQSGADVGGVASARSSTTSADARIAPPGSAALDLEGRLEIPPDWKILPRTVERWSRTFEGLSAVAVVEDVLLVSARGTVHALVPETGDERWSVTVGSPATVIVPGCEGRALLVAGGQLVVIRVGTGDVLSRAEVSGRPEHVRGHGCLVSYVAPARDGNASIWSLDTRGGDPRRLSAPYEIVSMSDSTRHHIVFSRIVTSPGSRHAEEREVSLASGTESALPPGTEHIAGAGSGRVLVGWFDEALSARRADGTSVWARPLGSSILARVDDDLILGGPRSIERVHMPSGTVRWTRAISRELADPLLQFEATVAGNRMIYAREDEIPAVIFAIDLTDGSSLFHRLHPGGSLAAIGDDSLFLRRDEGLAAIAIDRQGPPPRDSMTLEDDVRRSVLQLGAPNPTYYEGLRVPPERYPLGADQAIAWLARLGPLAEQPVAELVRRGSIEDASTALCVFAASHSALGNAAAVAALERSLSPQSDGLHLELRVRAAQAYGRRPLPEELADALSRDAIRAWTDLRPHLARLREDLFACASPECLHRARALAMVEATRDLLERASTRSEAVLALRMALLEGTPPAPPCNVEQDEIQLAAVRIMLDLSLSSDRRHRIVAEGSTCTALATTGGLVPMGATGAGDHHVERPVRVAQPPSWGDPAWDAAPAWLVRVHWWLDWHHHAFDYFVRRVDGVWRAFAAWPDELFAIGAPPPSLGPSGESASLE